MEIFEWGNQGAKIVLIQLCGEHNIGAIEKETLIIKENTNLDIKMIAIKVDDWNADLSPWSAPTIFGDSGFAGKADATFEKVMEICSNKSKTYFIGGYSLAGLFALWAAYKSDIFKGVAAASPSIWFPGFVEYMKENEIKSSYVYLSLGDKEAKTRNRVMATVGDKIKEAYDWLSENNVDCFFEWNQGNHFKDAELRTARGFSMMLTMYFHK